MLRATSCLISALVMVGASGATSRSEGLAEPEALTDDDLARLAKVDQVEIFDERPGKPFDRDTQVRLTGEELAARGATDLATALSLLPEVTVREASRGGFVVELRGARGAAVAVLIDGIAAYDPATGTLDLSTLPITDIVQIRISTTPRSPIDGLGGSGGVIEVLTRDAVGSQLVIARLTADSLPRFGLTGTARAALGKHVALRLSGSGLAGARDLETAGGSLGEARRAATGSGRLEYRHGDRRVAIDGFLDDRHYVAPTSARVGAGILLVDRELSARTQIKADDKFGALAVHGEYFVGYTHRKARRYDDDPALTNELRIEDLASIRSGGMLLATRPFARDFHWIASAAAEHDKVLVIDEKGDFVRGDVTLLETAVGLGYAHGRLRVDAAGGLAVPFGVGRDPWPEAKLLARYQPRADLELAATTAYKARLPTLLERYSAGVGNAALDPEQTVHAEVRAIAHRDHLRVEVAPFYRHTEDTIIVAEPLLVNSGQLDVYGVDTQARVDVHAMLELGGAYNYLHAKNSTSDALLVRLPRHRVEAWARVFATTRYAALARVRHFGASTENGAPVEGYTLLEVNLTAQLTKTLLGVVRVDDLLADAPARLGGFTAPGRVISVVLQSAWQ